MGLGRKPQLLGLLTRVVVGGQLVTGHVLPTEILEGAHLIVGDRILGVDHHAVLAGEQTEAPSIVGPARLPVLVEIQPGLHTRIDRRHVVVGVVHRYLTVLPDRKIVVAERLRSLATGHVVELVDEHHVRVVDLDDFRDVLGLLIVRRGQVAQQLPRLIAVQGRVVRGHAQPVLVAGRIRALRRRRRSPTFTSHGRCRGAHGESNGECTRRRNDKGARSSTHTNLQVNTQ